MRRSWCSQLAMESPGSNQSLAISAPSEPVNSPGPPPLRPVPYKNAPVVSNQRSMGAGPFATTILPSLSRTAPETLYRLREVSSSTAPMITCGSLETFHAPAGHAGEAFLQLQELRLWTASLDYRLHRRLRRPSP